MKLFFIITFFSILLTYQNSRNKIQAKWKLAEVESFLNIMTSESYNMLSEEQKTETAKVFQFALDSTFYEFKSDSVFFTDAGPGEIVKHKKGRWILKEDTLIILESDKIKSHKYIVDKLTED